jgi:hypothetical protein
MSLIRTKWGEIVPIKRKVRIKVSRRNMAILLKALGKGGSEKSYLTDICTYTRTIGLRIKDQGKKAV